MKILYIDNRRYIHNAELHVDFISSLQRYNRFNIIAYGKHLKRKFKNIVVPSGDVLRQLEEVLITHKPRIILTYNSGGDNVGQYEWVSEFLKKVQIPKFHITTDYLRSGIDNNQVNWFADHNYNAAIFRTKSSLNMPCSVPSFHLPFSVDAPLYNKFSEKNIKSKRNKVGFLGTTTLAPNLYYKRISAMNLLRDNDLLFESKFLEKQGRAQMFFGSSYVKFLTKNLFGLTCSGSCDYFTAKYFQIPSAYSMLVCTDVTGLESFPDDTYIKYDVSNLDKLKEDVFFHIENKSITMEKIHTLYSYVIKHHNNKVRGKELKEIIMENI